MKIAAKLKISTGFSIGMVLVIGLIVYLSYREMDRVSHQEKTIQKMVNGVFELNNLTNEYVLSHRERTWKQWQLRYDSLSEIIQSEGFYTIEEKLLLEEMQQNHERSKNIFYRLITDYESKGNDGQVTVDVTELEKILIGNLFSSSLFMTSNAKQLIVINQKKLDIAQKNIGLTLVFLISMAVVVIITSMFFLRKSIIKPIARLYEGAEIIGSGNLNYKVDIKTKDEIGKLSDAFDRMTDNLNVVTVSRDELTKEINERKQTEMALRESEANLAQAQRLTHLGSWQYDPETKKMMWSTEMFRIHGLDPEHGTPPFNEQESLIYPGDWNRLNAAVQNAVTSGKGYDLDVRIVHPDGNVRIVNIIGDPQCSTDGRVIRIVGTTQDITERKQAEEKIRENQIFLDSIVKNIPNMVFVKDAKELRFQLFNKAGEILLGYKREDLIGKNDYDLFPKEQADFFTKKDREVLSSGKLKDIPEEPIKTKYGERILHTKKIPVFDENSNEIYLLGISEDITESKEAEIKLKESESRHKVLFEASADGILIVDIETKEFKYANPALCKMLGYSEEELKTMGVEDIHPKESLEYVISEFEAQVRGEKTLAQNIPCLRKDGEIVYTDINATSALIDGRNCDVGFFRDITEHRQLEEQFRQSQKMEAVGRLAGGVAHDFNNLLTAMLGYSEMLIADPGLNDSQRKYIEEIKKSSERAALLTQQLLAFSRKQILKPKILNINTLITEIKKMLHRLIGEDIHLISKLDSKLGVIKADPGQVEQVIMNLVVNARDAMPKGGKLTIETQNVYLDEEYSKAHADVQPGWYVMLAVSDTGHGMDEETRKRIFEPFFTTKEKGKGTGLGLSTVYGIVKQSGGYVWVYSELNKGTSFKIYFPRVDKVEKEDEKKFKDKKSLKGSETILIVEDEEMVRNLIYESLKIFGYDLIEAENGKKALHVCKKNNEKPTHLLITDVIMPDMGGSELAKKLEKLKPKMKVLYISGYTDNAIVHHGVLDEGVAFLQKPFSPQALAQKVRGILDAE